MFKGGGYARLTGCRDGEYARMARMRERRPTIPTPAPYVSQFHLLSSLWTEDGESSKVERERYRNRKQPIPNRARKAQGGAVDVISIPCLVSVGPATDNESSAIDVRRTGRKKTKAGSKYRVKEEAYSELKGSHLVGSKRRGMVGKSGNCKNRICRQSAKINRLNEVALGEGESGSEIRRGKRTKT
jgi:hypothetical protein